MSKKHTDEAANAAVDEQTPTQEATITPASQEEPAAAQLIRVTADFANYKRRMDKERTQWIQTGQSAVIQAFLPIIDDIERALQATPVANDETEHEGLAQAREGFTLIEKNIRKVLEDLGVQEIDCVGTFDPHYHEALMQTQSDDHESGQIVQVLSKGYTYKESVIRHAKVSVSA